MFRAYFGPDAGEDVMQQHHVLLLDSSAITELTALYTQVLVYLAIRVYGIRLPFDRSHVGH
jgi:hypothetical protein